MPELLTSDLTDHERKEEEDALAFIGGFRNRQNFRVENVWIVKPIGVLSLPDISQSTATLFEQLLKAICLAIQKLFVNMKVYVYFHHPDIIPVVGDRKQQPFSNFLCRESSRVFKTNSVDGLQGSMARDYGRLCFEYQY